MNTDQIDYIVALRAVWLLFIRSRWNELARLGLKRAEVEPVLLHFDREKFGASHRLTGKRQVYSLLVALPVLLEAAVRLVGVYMILHSEEIQEYVKSLPSGSQEREP